MTPHETERKDLKWDEGKLQYMLILPEFLRGMAKVLTLGEKNHPKVDGQPSWTFHDQRKCRLDAY